MNEGTLVLGINDGSVDITSPSITAIGTSQGIGAKKVNVYFKFFDGIIKGSTEAKPETTTEVEYQYEAHNFTDEFGYQYCILEKMEG